MSVHWGKRPLTRPFLKCHSKIVRSGENGSTEPGNTKKLVRPLRRHCPVVWRLSARSNECCSALATTWRSPSSVLCVWRRFSLLNESYKFSGMRDERWSRWWLVPRVLTCKIHTKNSMRTALRGVGKNIPLRYMSVLCIFECCISVFSRVTLRNILM